MAEHNDITIVLRQIKQQPLTVEELDQNFLNLKTAIIQKDGSSLDLIDNVPLPFGNLPAFELYTDGEKMVVESKTTGLSDDAVIFEVRDGDANAALFQVTKDGRMLGVLDPTNMEVDWNELLTGPSGISLVVDEGEAYTLLTDYNNIEGLNSSERGKGTIAYAGGDIYLNVGD